MDILFIKLGALGDVINTLPLAITLKEKLGARIHWLVEPLSLPILASHSSVHRTILFDKKHWAKALPGLIKELKSSHFDITLDLQRLIKTGLFTMIADSDRKIGFDRARCKEFTWLFPFERIKASDPTVHMANQYLEFAHHLGVNPGEIRWDIQVPDKSPFNLPDKYVVLNIGATTSAKRWTAEGFASLADGLLKRYQIQAVLTGGPSDSKAAEQIMSLCRANIINLTGKTSFQDLTYVIARSCAVVTGDTGPMHLAVALSKEVIALIGPTNPKRTGPLKGHVIRQNLSCMPCNKRQCEDPVCMQSITADMVLSELGNIL